MDRVENEARSQVTSMRPSSQITSKKMRAPDDILSRTSTLGSNMTKLTLLEQELTQERHARRLLEREMKQIKQMNQTISKKLGIINN